MSMFPDTTRPMQLCAAMVEGMPVYESTGIETKKAAVREEFTHCLLDLCGELYMGAYSIGESFSIGYVKLLNLQTDLVLEKQYTVDRLHRYFSGRLDVWTLASWVDKLLDNCDGQRQINFKWM